MDQLVLLAMGGAIGAVIALPFVVWRSAKLISASIVVAAFYDPDDEDPEDYDPDGADEDTLESEAWRNQTALH